MESMPAAAVPAVDQAHPSADTPRSPAKRSLDATQECIQLKVQFGKDAVTVERPLDTTVGDLKRDIEERTGTQVHRRPSLAWVACKRALRAAKVQHAGIPPSNQKLLYKGQLKDASTLREVRALIYACSYEVVCLKVTYRKSLTATDGPGTWQQS